MSYTVKDSGQRLEFDGGMVRDVSAGKVDYSLVFDGPMLERWAAHLTKAPYPKGNWLKAEGDAERQRARESACRHFVQWMRGDTDEDHAAALMFNLNLHEYVAGKLQQRSAVSVEPET